MQTRPRPRSLLAAAVLAAAAAAGCEPDGGGAPRPISIAPDRGSLAAPVAVRIAGEGFGAAVRTDFSRPEESDVDARFEVRLGAVALQQVALQPDGSLTAVVPPNLPSGPYDLVVVDPGGRSGTLPRAYRVLAPDEPGAPVAAFRVEAAAEQVARRPFAVTITALDAAGAPVTAFNGAVRLADSTGTVVPPVAGLFAAGRWSGEVEVRAAHPADVLTATDGEGRTGFAQVAVVPAPAAALAFASPPPAAVAGRCEGPITVALSDAFGVPTRAAQATGVVLATSGGEPLELFADAACAIPQGSPAIDAGEGSATFWFRATRAGAFDLTATSASLTSAIAPLDVAPGAPATIAFLTPPVTARAGECSAAITVEVRDGYGNPSPPDAALSLAADPADGLAFHGDPGCAGAISEIAFSPGAARADFHFRGTRAGPVTVTAAGAGTASQVEIVAPGAPARAVFVTAPQSVEAGSCSAPVEVRIEDVHGNPSPAAAETAVALSAAPATGVAFHSDAGCALEVSAATLAAGASVASFRYRATRAGTLSIAAAVPGLAAPATQPATVTPGPPDGLAWDPVPSPQLKGVPFPVRLRAHDAFGNDTPAFGGAAALSASAGAVTCASACSGASVTSAFTDGVWEGWLAVPDAGSGIFLAATAGALSGTSSALDVVDRALRSPPLARFTFSPAVVLAGEAVSFDATPSSDYETPAEALEVSWDLQATAASFASPAVPPGAPWTAWTTAKTISRTYAAAGVYQPRLAVRDGEPGPGGPDVGYATATVVVLARATTLCTVTSAADVDDGATSCTSGRAGADGQLSLREALRLANGMGATPTVAFARPMTISGTGSLTISRDMNVVAQTGVVLDGLSLTISAQGVLVSGLELARLSAPLTVAPAGDVTLRDLHVHDGAGIEVLGSANLSRVRMEACAGACVRANDAASSRLAVLFSDFRGTGGDGVRLDACAAPETSGVYAFSPIILGSSFTGFGTAIRSSCNATVVNGTFATNGTGIHGTGAYLLNSVFTGHSVEAVGAASCAGAFPWYRRQQLVWQNASDGCLAPDVANPAGTGTISADPLYVFPAARDHRIQHGSPAKDSGDDPFEIGVYATDLNDAGPGLFFGAAPDRGGWETY